jgi:hypothetical protein
MKTASEAKAERLLRIESGGSIVVVQTAEIGALPPFTGTAAKDSLPPISAVRAVVAKGSFGSRRTEGFPPTLPVNLYNQKSRVLSAAMCAAMSESR